MMMQARFRTLVALGFLLYASTGQAAEPSLADQVNTLVGTDSSREVSRGNTYPAAVWPFGMVAWTAQTGETNWAYRYSQNNSFQGIRATHRPSVWMNDYGPFALMPMDGDVKMKASDRAARFLHEKETAKPHLYTVELEGSGIKIEVTPGPRTSFMRFTFPAGTRPVIALDAFAGGSSVRILPKGKIVGFNSQVYKTAAPGFKHHFTIAFDREFRTSGTWDGAVTKVGSVSQAGPHVGAFVTFETAKMPQTIQVRVGTSFISTEQAEINVRREMPDWDFAAAIQRARRAWDDQLGRIEIQGASDAQRVTFYSSLYHAFQYPRFVHEVDAQNKTVHYSAFDDKIHDGPAFSDTGFWDTFRAVFPLFTIINQKRDNEIIQSMLNVYDEGGWIPRWPNPSYTNVMIGTHGDSVIADAFVKGIRGYDTEKAYAAIRKDATQKGTGHYAAREGIEDYIHLGYVPHDKVNESASRTLEFAYDDFCVAQMARGLNKSEDHATFSQRAGNYRNLYDPKSGFMRGRNSDGSWQTPFDPVDWGSPFTEGNALQYSWSVQQDVPGMIKLFGGQRAFLKKLDALFSASPDFKVGAYKRVIHEMTEAKMGNMGQYAHNNEPVHHVIYLYTSAGEPWKTQALARKIMNEMYSPGPAGRLGDEDNGQMSAWYIFSALGLYPINPCQPIYVLGSPLFGSASVHLENGKTFSVTAENNSPANMYVQATTLDGKSLDRAWISHDEIMGGGRLVFKMGPKPNRRWGTKNLPPGGL